MPGADAVPVTGVDISRAAEDSASFFSLFFVGRPCVVASSSLFFLRAAAAASRAELSSQRSTCARGATTKIRAHTESNNDQKTRKHEHHIIKKELTYKLCLAAERKCADLIEAYNACVQGRTLTAAWACKRAYRASGACISE
jgi:hypothetical protein